MINSEFIIKPFRKEYNLIESKPTWKFNRNGNFNYSTQYVSDSEIDFIDSIDTGVNQLPNEISLIIDEIIFTSLGNNIVSKLPFRITTSNDQFIEFGSPNIYDSSFYSILNRERQIIESAVNYDYSFSRQITPYRATAGDIYWGPTTSIQVSNNVNYNVFISFSGLRNPTSEWKLKYLYIDQSTGKTGSSETFLYEPIVGTNGMTSIPTTRRVRNLYSYGFKLGIMIMTDVEDSTKVELRSFVWSSTNSQIIINSNSFIYDLTAIENISRNVLRFGTALSQDRFYIAYGQNIDIFSLNQIDMGLFNINEFNRDQLLLAPFIEPNEVIVKICVVKGTNVLLVLYDRVENKYTRIISLDNFKVTVVYTFTNNINDIISMNVAGSSIETYDITLISQGVDGYMWYYLPRINNKFTIVKQQTIIVPYSVPDYQFDSNRFQNTWLVGSYNNIYFLNLVDYTIVIYDISRDIFRFDASLDYNIFSIYCEGSRSSGGSGYLVATVIPLNEPYPIKFLFYGLAPVNVRAIQSTSFNYFERVTPLQIDPKNFKLSISLSNGNPITDAKIISYVINFRIKYSTMMKEINPAVKISEEPYSALSMADIEACEEQCMEGECNIPNALTFKEAGGDCCGGGVKEDDCEECKVDKFMGDSKQSCAKACFKKCGRAVGKVDDILGLVGPQFSVADFLNIYSTR